MIYLFCLLLCLNQAAVALSEPGLDSGDDDTPYISPNLLTLSPLAPTERELQRNALREQFRQDLPDLKDAQERFKEMQKNWPGVKTSPEKPIKDMNLTELIQRKNELIIQGDYKLALKYLDHIIKMIEHADQAIFVMLETAEILMKIEQYAKAERLFSEFIQLYPGNEFVEQAYVKAIRCSWNQTSTFDRDQTKTEETLTLISRFETRLAICSAENIAAVAEVKYLCEQKLANANMYVAKHYIGRGIYRSAHKRLDDVREKDLCKVPQIEPELLQLEIELARSEKNKTVEDAKLAELILKYPQHEITLAFLPKGQLPNDQAQQIIA